jgi:2'-5' RNA ligase
MRTFVSIDVPDRLRGPLASLQRELADGEDVRLTDPGNAHLTLFFLGETDPERVPEIADALERAVAGAGVAPFGLELGGVGAFPSLDYVSVVWVGVREGASETATLQAAVEGELAELGFEGDDHEFTPHVTLARMDGPRGKERVRELATERDPTVGRFVAGEVRLVESELTDDSPEYRTVASVSLPDG